MQMMVGCKSCFTSSTCNSWQRIYLETSFFFAATKSKDSNTQVDISGALKSGNQRGFGTEVFCESQVIGAKNIAQRLSFGEIDVAVGEMAEWFKAHAWKA